MEETKINFYLTGSRAFGKCNNLTDYDFFAQSSSELTFFLDSNGFKPVEYYQGSFVHPSCLEVRRLGIVDIQVIANAEIKNAAQLELLKQFPNSSFNLLKKEVRSAFWTLAIQNQVFKRRRG